MSPIDIHLLAGIFVAAQAPHLEVGDEDRRISIVREYVAERCPGFEVGASGNSGRDAEFRTALLGAIRECRLAIRMVGR